MKAAAVAMLLSVASCSAFAQSSPQPSATVANPAKYGAFPNDYMTIVKDWLATQLLDPGSAVVEFISQPKPAELPTRDGKQASGYLVEFKVNSRNRFGAYTGFQKHGALIRDGKVVRGTGFGY